MNNNVFTACKLAYIDEGKLLVYKRDNFSHIIYPNLWDLPGGGREANESPEQCILREFKEEFSISLEESRLIYKRKVPSDVSDGFAYFFVAFAKDKEVENISFGNEGQYWKFMTIDEFLTHPEVIASMKNRLIGYLEDKNNVLFSSGAQFQG